MKPERRWLKSVIAASAVPQIRLPWARRTRSRPAVMPPSGQSSAVLLQAQVRKTAARHGIGAL